jgi:hypothetical protein
VFDARRRSDRWIEGGERVLEREFANGFALGGLRKVGSKTVRFGRFSSCFFVCTARNLFNGRGELVNIHSSREQVLRLIPMYSCSYL